MLGIDAKFRATFHDQPAGIVERLLLAFVRFVLWAERLTYLKSPAGLVVRSDARPALTLFRGPIVAGFASPGPAAERRAG